jgi:hypothetical protein
MVLIGKNLEERELPSCFRPGKMNISTLSSIWKLIDLEGELRVCHSDSRY